MSQYLVRMSVAGRNGCQSSYPSSSSVGKTRRNSVTAGGKISDPAFVHSCAVPNLAMPLATHQGITLNPTGFTFYQRDSSGPSIVSPFGRSLLTLVVHLSTANVGKEFLQSRGTADTAENSGSPSPVVHIWSLLHCTLSLKPSQAFG